MDRLISLDGLIVWEPILTGGVPPVVTTYEDDRIHVGTAFSVQAPIIETNIGGTF